MTLLEVIIAVSIFSITAIVLLQGFVTSSRINRKSNLYLEATTAAQNIMEEVKQVFRPEFLNRVDEIVCFNHLTKENFAGIARIMLDELKASLGDKGYTLRYDEALVDYLVEKSYSLTYGARNLRRLIQKELEDPMATKIIDSYEHPVSRIHAAAENEAIRLDAL